VNSTLDFVTWLWSYIRPYLALVIVAIIGIFLFTFSNAGAVIYAFHKLLSQLEAGTLSDGLAVSIPEIPYILPAGYRWVVASGTKYEILNTLMLYGLGIVVIRVIADFVRLFVMKYVSISVARDIRSRLYENILRRPVTFFEQRNVGDLMSRVSNDVGKVKKAVNVGLRDIFMAPLELVVALGLVTYFAPYLALFFLIIPFCGYAIYHVGQRIRRYSRASQDVMGNLNSLIQERFSGIKLVKSVAQEDVEIEDFNRRNSKHFRKLRRKIASDSLLRPAMHSFVLFPALGILYVAATFVMQGYLTLSALATFVIALPYIYKSLRKLSNLNQTIQTARGAAERIENIFQEQKDYNQDLQDGDQTPEFKDDITFDSVSYHYPGYDELALRDVNFQFEQGKNVALVGPSGAGKSTFTDLLMRFIDPTSGEIRLDGQPLSDYDLQEYRRIFGLVTQQPILFDDSIRENVRYGRKDISDERIVEAAAQAEASEFIENLPSGFDTMVGEEGVKLSGGEKQRIALARALVSNPKILILDEATSDVDSRSEKKIISAIENLPGDITLLTISHALSTVQFADETLVLNDHALEAVGTHSELIDDSPTYRELYEHQVGDLKTSLD
jgi:subfamily B ATP-binding cassette protein MsbA